MTQGTEPTSARDEDELVLAKNAALTNTIPFLYIILAVNSWGLAADFFGKAPIWLTLHVSAALTLICMARLAVWARRRGRSVTAAQARRELRRTRILAGVLSAAFPAWGFALFPHGDAYAQSHIAFFMAVSMIGCVLCLTQLPSAALIVAAIGGVGFVVFFASTGIPALMAMAGNLMIVASVLAAIVIVQDRNFTRMVRAQTEARRREQDQSRLMRMINDMPVAVMTVDPEALTVNYANPASAEAIRQIEHLLPIRAEDLVGSRIDALHGRAEHLADPAHLPHRDRIRIGSEVLDLKISAVTSDDGGYIGPMLTWEIVTRQVEAEERIRQLAHHDALTGLLNRYTFHEQLSAWLAERRPLALLFMDLDGFKLVNDAKGHTAGDALLVQVAERLRAHGPDGDSVIARLGGDEFALLTPDMAGARALAADLIEAVSAVYVLDDDRQVRIGASIGLALAPEHGRDAGVLLARADMALYAAKAAGKGVARLFHPDMEAQLRERIQLESALREALDEADPSAADGPLFVFYQPILNLKTGEVTAREALARWRHPQRGWISPGEFIPVAEESGLIDRLGGFVLRQACRDTARWTDGARVAINISAAQLGKGLLVPAVLEALMVSGLSPDRLELEVTETAMMDGAQDVLGDLRRLRAAGVRIALDDFGTGYSSLAHLRAFPFDKIKIDGSFVRDAVDRADCAAVVRAVAELGARLGVTTVAEGVETDIHLERVRQEGCDEAQGFYFGRPMPMGAEMPDRAAPPGSRLAAAGETAVA